MTVQGDDTVYLRRFQHAFKEPADVVQVKGALETLGIMNPALEGLYALSNGAVLFSVLSEAEAEAEAEEEEEEDCFIQEVVIHPVEDLSLETDVMTSWFEHVDVAERPICSSGVAIASLTGTGNSFVLMREGPWAGAVFLFDHDDDQWDDAPVARSLSDFIEGLSASPSPLMAAIVGVDDVRFG
jgi:hypothetical protein